MSFSSYYPRIPVRTWAVYRATKKAIETDISAHEFTWFHGPRIASSHRDAG